MKTEYFPHFVRRNYPKLPHISNEELIEIGNQFKDYLLDKFNGKEDKLEPIWDITPKNVILNISSPFRTNGYNPALFIHFDNFLKELTASKEA